jgi:hypothetical protein
MSPSGPVIVVSVWPQRGPGASSLPSAGNRRGRGTSATTASTSISSRGLCVSVARRARARGGRAPEGVMRVCVDYWASANAFGFWVLERVGGGGTRMNMCAGGARRRRAPLLQPPRQRGGGAASASRPLKCLLARDPQTHTTRIPHDTHTHHTRATPECTSSTPRHHPLSEHPRDAEEQPPHSLPAQCSPPALPRSLPAAPPPARRRAARAPPPRAGAPACACAQCST